MENQHEKSSIVNLMLDNQANDYIQTIMYYVNSDKYSDSERVELSKQKLKEYLHDRYHQIQELANMDILELRKLLNPL